MSLYEDWHSGVLVLFCVTIESVHYHFRILKQLEVSIKSYNSPLKGQILTEPLKNKIIDF